MYFRMASYFSETVMNVERWRRKCPVPDSPDLKKTIETSRGDEYDWMMDVDETVVERDD